MEKKYWIIAFLGLFTLISGISNSKITKVNANSASYSYEGTDGNGVVVLDDECKVEVTNEDLTFRVDLESESYVSAKYTFYNPTDINYKLRLAFPTDDYIAGDYNADVNYTIKKDDQEIESKVRYTYKNESSVLENMKFLKDEKIHDDFFNEDLKVYEHNFTYAVEDLSDANCLALNLQSSYNGYFMANISGWESVSNGYNIRIWLSNIQDGCTIYFLGEDMPNYQNYIKFYDNWDFDHEKKGTITEKSTQILTFDELIDKYKNVTDIEITDVDYYNAVIGSLCNSYRNSRNFINLTSIKLNDYNLIKWYDYSMNINAHETITNEVIYRIIPYYFSNYTPYLYTFKYFLSPASTWNSFSNLNIKVETNNYVYSCSLGNFQKVENGYELHFDTLPEDELSFEMGTSESYPVRNISPYSIILTILFIGVLIGFCGPLVASIVLLICDSVKHKNEEKDIRKKFAIFDIELLVCSCIFSGIFFSSIMLNFISTAITVIMAIIMIILIILELVIIKQKNKILPYTRLVISLVMGIATTIMYSLDYDIRFSHMWVCLFLNFVILVLGIVSYVYFSNDVKKSKEKKEVDVNGIDI